MMRTLQILSVSVLLLALAADPAGAPRGVVTALQEPRPLIVIAVDGLRPDYVLAPERHGRPIPHFARFVAEGAWAAGVEGVVPSVTYPSFTTILTGVDPARHGIVANTPFDPMQRNQSGWYWYASDIAVPTLWQAARDAGLRTASVHWPVSVGAPVDFNLPQIWRAGTPEDRKLLRALATPGLQESLEAEVGEAYADGIDESIEGDERRARFAVRLLERERPDFATLYFTALDHEQHVRGPHTPEVYDVLARLDALLGEVVGAVERAYDGRAVIAVVSDHGFHPTERALSLAAVFREAGLIDVDDGGAIAGWRASPWTAGSSAAVVLADPGDRALEGRVRALLDSLAAEPVHGIARVIDRDELHARGGFPGASFLVSLRPGFLFSGSVGGPVLGPTATAGMHGHLPDDPELHTSFLIRGPGVPRRSLGTVRLVDVAPTLAGILRVELPSAEGRTLLP